MNDFNKRLGNAIQSAQGQLPDGYDLTIEIEHGAAIVALWIPPVNDEDCGRRVTEFDGDDLVSHINSAVEMAIEHDTLNRDMGSSETPAP